MADFTKLIDDMAGYQHEEFMQTVSPMEFDKIVQNRRSVRFYTNEKVPVEVVDKVLDWALMAANSSNLQPWEFYWVKDPAKKAKLIEACMSQPAARTAQELIVAVAKRKTWKTVSKQMLAFLNEKPDVPKAAKDYYGKIVPLAYTQGPLGIIGLLKKIFLPLMGISKPIPREPASIADMRVWAVKSTSLACQNIMMGFSAFGFDTCPMEGFDSARVKSILDLKCGDEVVMVISAGKRDPKGVYGPRIRMPREQFVKII
ncbi:MAG: nitroreductase family protein [Bacteriovoracaceae bacterium]